MPPETRVAAFLSRARRRLLSIDALWTIAAACLGASVALMATAVVGGPRQTTVALAIAGALVAAALVRLRARSWKTSEEVERRTPVFQNTLVTAAELLEPSDRVRPAIRALVLEDAAARIERASLPSLAPLRTPALTALACAGIFAIAIAATPARDASGAATFIDGLAAGGAAEITSVTVIVTPPLYARAQSITLENPDRVEALEGSRIAIHIEAHATRVALVAGDDETELTRSTDGRFEGEITLDDQSFLRLTPASNDEGAARLIQLAITPDGRPEVAVTSPGRDMVLPKADGDIPVAVSARDDYGLTSLTLAYTKVSGSGESFEFLEGELPLSLARADTRSWTATSTLRLGALGLAPGDMLVYRALARDARPGRGAAESDAFVIEIASGSEAMAEGFTIDDQRDAYAISQQMVILKTERLIARRKTLTQDELVEEAARLAAEQRQVRAEFVFMMGGEVEDEEVEAEHSHEIEEGREQNRGRIDLVTAIRAMSDASALLMKPDLDQALIAERNALAALQRAFTRARYILRVLSRRERIDETRRLSGDRTEALSWRRAAAGDTSREAGAIEEVLLRLSLIARRDRYEPGDLAAMTDIAQAILAAAPASPHARDAAAHLTRATREDDPGAVRAAVDAAALELDAALEAEATGAAPPSTERAPHALRSELADLLRRGARR